MRLVPVLACSLFLLVSFGSAGEKDESVFALEARLHDLTKETIFWPGFDPLEIPLAVFDGTDTYLFRHPDPPEGFVSRGEAHVMRGRHPGVVAHSSARIGEVATATILLDGPIAEDDLSSLAPIVVHEAFHVFQTTTERSWSADESQLFMYPVDDVDLLAERRLENDALRRAVEADDDRLAAGWALRAIEIRSSRNASLDAGLSAYERGIEAKEGTAYYVQLHAEGRQHPEFPPDGFPVEGVRRRAYETGVSWALLLDRFHSDWRAGFAADDQRYLDQVLEEALQGVESSPECTFSALELGAVREAAQRDVDELRTERARLRQSVESSPGWRIVLEADSATPLWPRGFDPMNIRKLDSGLLHTRFLQLGNDAGAIEVMNDTVQTWGVGSHPLYNGVKRATIAGIESEPQVYSEADSVAVVTPTVTARFRGAEIDRIQQKITIRLRGE